MLKTFEAKVYVRNGSTRIMHTVRVQADSSFAAQQLLSAQYGQNNLVGVPTEVRNPGTKFDSSPWMKRR